MKMTLHSALSLGLIFSWEKWGNWTSVPNGNCSYISELDVRLLNHPNWISITQVMVRFSGLSQAALFWLNLLSRFLGLISVEKRENLDSILQGTCSSI